jgi:carbonic anhydrase
MILSIKKMYEYMTGNHKRIPKLLYIGCCDSCVVPDTLIAKKTKHHPLEIIMVQNMGNQVFDKSVLSAVQLAVETYNINNVIICGHSDCKTIELCISAIHDNQILTGALYQWLQPLYERIRMSLNYEGNISLDQVTKDNIIHQKNILQDILPNIKIIPYFHNQKNNVLEDLDDEMETNDDSLAPWSTYD